MRSSRPSRQASNFPGPQANLEGDHVCPSADRQTGMTVDLHWRPFNHPQHAGNQLMDGPEGFSRRNLFLYVALHGTNDGWLYLKGLADIAGFVQKLSLPEMEDALDYAKHLGLLEENVSRFAFVSALLARQGVLTLVAAMSPYRAGRAAARAQAARFVEVFVDAPLAVCEQRDPVGIYRRFRSREIQNVSGLDEPYEEPQFPDIHCRTSATTCRPVRRRSWPTCGPCSPGIVSSRRLPVNRGRSHSPVGMPFRMTASGARFCWPSHTQQPCIRLGVILPKRVTRKMRSIDEARAHSHPSLYRSEFRAAPCGGPPPGASGAACVTAGGPRRVFAAWAFAAGGS